MEEQFDFLALEQCVFREIQDDPAAPESTALRTASWIGWAGAGIGLLFALIWKPLGIAPFWALGLVMFGLFLELVGFVSFVAIGLVRWFPRRRSHRTDFAKELDVNAAQASAVIAWLRKFPAEERKRMLRFVEGKREAMTYGMGLILGGFERLGIFPILIAVYFQFRELKHIGWDVLTDINWPAGLCLVVLGMFYGMGWMLARHKMQLNGYARFLAASLEERS